MLLYFFMIYFDYTLILLLLSMGHKLLQHFNHTKCFVIFGLQTIFRTQFIGMFLIYLYNKFHIPR